MSSASLEDKFNAAVKTIQHLPNDGTFQPSNEMKLTFYGLYKQATAGPCKEARPSLFNYINRAKWDAWDKCRPMSKESAMLAYIDEIRKILETMPQTNEVLDFTQLIGPFYEFVDDQSAGTSSISTIKKKTHHTNMNSKKSNSLEPYVNGISEDNHDERPLIHTNGPIQTLVSAGNGPAPSSSPSSSSTSSISSSDVDEFYDDPPDRFPLTHGLSNDEISSNNNNIQKTESLSTTTNIPHEQTSDSTIKHHPHVYGGQDGTNAPLHHSNRGGNHSNQNHRSSSHHHHHDLSDGARYSPSSMISGGGNGRHPNNNYNKETQRAILTALTKLQRDVNNILERLNQLETSTHFLQQRELSTQLHRSSEPKAISRWFPLSGLRRRAVAFILLWPFFVFAVIRLFLRARIIIRFRQPRR
ncbi:unnamed protein product [Adineta steineri]|uniref:ACB domain-containing protein n=1 Tax=Adineta steineri TaxID=433720 RepID=A0A813QCR3_9BILA|nr:unnamed protein product [Adineta steineri]CAF3751471.1 unnamed protein product [Adineta steineri]